MVRGIVPIALFGVLTGCTADTGDEGILVLKNVHVTGDTCVTDGTATELTTSHGSLELLLPSPYLFIAQLKSRIVAPDGQADQRTIITSGANIDIEFPGSTLFSEAELAELKASGLTHYKALFSSPVFPNGGITDVGFNLIPAALTRRIADQAGVTQGPANTKEFAIEVVASFTVVGSMSGQSVESQRFSYPITIATHASLLEVGACPLPESAATTLQKGYVCNPAQDGAVDCCVQDGAFRCPATVSDT